MKIKRLSANKKAKIEIIPMIDVMFFLLVTFIITSLSMRNYQGIAVNLNKGKSENILQDQTITITITKDNLIYVNKNLVDLTKLSDEVKKLLNGEEKIILLACDQDSKQGTSTQAMLEIKRAGGNHFSIITKP
jgi:biopolymer transport protein ExbD